ncbi:MAG: RpiB/LacA/LacB family sugar-phosphate isomerase [Candidatus Aenigmarchaeota archaeon]|nr:RpiB/LacA/LacB family sugar-phosphate isomerase [Candidatus Aenigmarchaeota archaeon]
MKEVWPWVVTGWLNGIRLEDISSESVDHDIMSGMSGSHAGKKVFVGSMDDQKDPLGSSIHALKSLNYDVVDVGTGNSIAVSERIGTAIAKDPYHSVGIGFGQTGNDVLVLGSKCPFVIGSRCVTVSDAETTRRHNNPNFLGVGSSAGTSQIPLILTWLETEFYTGSDSDDKKRMRRYLQTLAIKSEAYEQAGIRDTEAAAYPMSSYEGKIIIYLGSDHRAADDFRKLEGLLHELDNDLEIMMIDENIGYCNNESSSQECDYPLISAEVGRMLSKASSPALAIVGCGSGIGMISGAANYEGVYAARCLSNEDAERAVSAYNNCIGIGCDLVGFDKGAGVNPFDIAGAALAALKERSSTAKPDSVINKLMKIQTRIYLKEAEGRIYQSAKKLYGF